MIRRVAVVRWGALVFVGAVGVLAIPRHLAAASRSGVARLSAVAVLAGGCYWGVESVFRHVRGVTSVISGYAVPMTAAGATSSGPAEAVCITYDPSRITYRRILDIFFSAVHDPTQVNRQGPDVGAEYRSIVFADDRQRGVVRAYIDSLTAARVPEANRD